MNWPQRDAREILRGIRLGGYAFAIQMKHPVARRSKPFLDKCCKKKKEKKKVSKTAKRSRAPRDGQDNRMFRDASVVHDIPQVPFLTYSPSLLRKKTRRMTLAVRLTDQSSVARNPPRINSTNCPLLGTFKWQKFKMSSQSVLLNRSTITISLEYKKGC